MTLHPCLAGRGVVVSSVNDRPAPERFMDVILTSTLLVALAEIGD